MLPVGLRDKGLSQEPPKGRSKVGAREAGGQTQVPSGRDKLSSDGYGSAALKGSHLKGCESGLCSLGLGLLQRETITSHPSGLSTASSYPGQLVKGIYEGIWPL